MTDSDPAVTWDGDQLRSTRFDDLYFSKQGGLLEAREVFLKGCGLPERWQGRRRFVVGELGFGTGLNMLALLQLWSETRPPGATLHMFSVEGYPLSRTDAARAHAAFPELSALSETLLAQWPEGARGMHRIRWPELGATLDLAVMEVGDALAGWDGKADAWFLDGFAPARNPEMWGEAVLGAVAKATAPGGRAATYSVAAAVRHGLAAAGFAVSRQPGFGHKRERLEAVLPGSMREADRLPRVAIIGAGIAGAALSRALGDIGLEPRVFALGPMASGNPAALVSPRLAAGSAAGAALHAQAFRRAVQLVRTTAPGAIIADGALRLLRGDGEQQRGAATVASGLFDAGSLRVVDASAAAAMLEESDATDALWMADALVVAPDELLGAWLGEVEAWQVSRIGRMDGAWALFGRDDDVVAEADVVILAAGMSCGALSEAVLRPVRGQVSVVDVALPGPPSSWGGYAIPTRGGLLFGATHDRGDDDAAVREGDDARNLDGLARVRPALAESVRGREVRRFAGVRAATGDHQPLAGPLGDGLHILAGLGGRGFTLAPLLAEHVVAGALGLPSPLPRASARLVDPRRMKAPPTLS